LSKQALQSIIVAQHPDPSTSYQFLLQHGREVNKGHDTPHIGDISYMLHAAGHQKTISLKNHHPDLNQSEELAKREYQRVLDYTRSHLSVRKK